MSAIRVPSRSTVICLAVATVLCFALIPVTSPARAEAPAPVSTDGINATCPGGQCFTDVAPGNTFYDYVNNLYMDDIVGGYACGGAGEPCDPQSRPYYRPTNGVSRAQMAKFADLGRRNIATAIGNKLTLTNNTSGALIISDTVNDGIYVATSSGSEAIQAVCTRANQDCWAVRGDAEVGDRSGYFDGGRGVYMNSYEAGYYTLDVEGGAYRGAYAKSYNSSYYSLYVDSENGSPTQGNYLGVNAGVSILGNLTVAGSKSGYVVDLMQNAGDKSLEVGDVVTIVGNADAILGEIPVVLVQKATTAYDTGVAGVVDQIMYVPDKATREAYAAQGKAMRDARARQAAAEQAGDKAAAVAIVMPDATITDVDGNPHPLADTTTAQPGGYMNVVTLGSYKGVKVDASFGAVKAGDLLVASPHAGYAMKASDRTLTSGATIGKALGGLATGTGVIPVMVTLK